jgi:hypothetical protein
MSVLLLSLAIQGTAMPKPSSKRAAAPVDNEQSTKSAKRVHPAAGPSTKGEQGHSSLHSLAFFALS